MSTPTPAHAAPDAANPAAPVLRGADEEDPYTARIERTGCAAFNDRLFVRLAGW